MLVAKYPIEERPLKKVKIYSEAMELSYFT